MHISHTVGDFRFFYEPYYVSHDSAPKHDERYIGYGSTRNTQVIINPLPFLGNILDMCPKKVFEMNLAGWNFTVLSPLFGIHLGRGSGRTSGWYHESRVNQRAWKEFARLELCARYGVAETSKHCLWYKEKAREKRKP